MAGVLETPDTRPSWDEKGWGKQRPDARALPVTRRRPSLWALGFSPVTFRIMWLPMGRERERGLRQMRAPLAVVFLAKSRGTDISRKERRGHSLEAAPAHTAPDLVNWGSGVRVRRSSGHFYGSFPSECYSPRNLQELTVLNIKGCSWILNKLMGSRSLMSKKILQPFLGP